MRHVDAYLVVPGPVAAAVGGLVWSLDGEALKRGDGTTFLLTAEVHAFLEGFALGRPLVAFGYLLLGLGLLRGRWGPKPGASPAIDRLREAFQAAGRGERNAGAFFAHLLADVPPAADAPSAWEVWRRAILGAADPLRLATQGLPEPALPLSVEQFLRLVEQRVTAYSREDLEAWLRTGSGPEREAGRQLAAALQARSARSLEGMLGERAERQRLAGALPLVEQLGAALTLPPRKLVNPDLPLGGYSDVTTHGHPEQLLLSQFALDELELLRRLAERELLYYRREEPRVEVREELVVVLDQGVRTWGTARLILLAATFALAQMASRRQLVFRIATTGRPEPWAPDDLSAEELAKRLEVSDLSPHPAAALGRVLPGPATLPRDVVLLTHPRSLDEPDVIDAAMHVPAGVRLFALTADREGHAGLGEFHHGRCVPLRDFRVDTTVRRTDAPSTGPHPTWTGAIDPVPSLFFLNPGEGSPTRFAFDEAERHVLLAVADGALLLVPLHGRAEMLPRVAAAGGVLRQVLWVHGIAGGFLVAGIAEGQVVVGRYDLAARRVDAWVLGPVEEQMQGGEWYYFPATGCVVLHLPEHASGPHRWEDRWHGLHLPTGAQQQTTAPVTDRPGPLSASLGEAAMGLVGLPDGWLRTSPFSPATPLESWARLDAGSGVLDLPFPDGRRVSWAPRADGEPALRGGSLLCAQRRENVFALAVALPESRDRKAGFHLFVCRCEPPEQPQLLLQTPLVADFASRWALSPRGTFLALDAGNGQVEIRGTEPGSTRRQITPRPRRDPAVEMRLGRGWLLVGSGPSPHLLQWNGGELRVERVSRLHDTLQERGLTTKIATPTQKVPAFLGHDPGRFRVVAVARLVAALDNLGLVSLFDVAGTFLAQVRTRADRLAVVTPAGERFGDPSLLGGPPTSDASMAIAARLRAAEALAPENW